MDTALASQIAKEIVDQQIIFNWRFYALILALNFVSISVSSFLHAHLSKRGEHLATKADFDSILDQLRLSTTLTAQINSVISRDDWAARELTTLRRLKLEELLNLLHDANAWLETERDAILFEGPSNSAREPSERLTTITTLYFSELNRAVASYLTEYNKQRAWLLRARRELIDANEGQKVPVVQRYTGEYMNYLKPLSDASMQLERAASGLMKRIIEPAPVE